MIKLLKVLSILTLVSCGTDKPSLHHSFEVKAPGPKTLRVRADFKATKLCNGSYYVRKEVIRVNSLGIYKGYYRIRCR